MGVFVLLVLALLAGHRIAVSYYVATLFDAALDDIDNEQAFTHEIHLGNFLGLKGIEEIVIRRNSENPSEPLVVVRQLQISPDWRSLMQGRKVADVSLGALEVNLLRSDFGRIDNTVDTHEGRAIFDRLKKAPINILAVNNAVVTFYDATRKPPASLYIKDMVVQVTNAVTSPDGKTTPATAALTAITSGGGSLSIYGRLTLEEEQPFATFDIALEHVDLAALNKTIESYASLEVESGTVNLWSHLKFAGQRLDGFVDQTIENLQMESLEKPEDLFSRQFGAMLLQSLREDSDGNFSGTVTISADLSETPSSVVGDTGRLLKMAFLRLFNFEENENLSVQDLSR